MRPCGLWLSTIPRKDKYVLKTCILIQRPLPAPPPEATGCKHKLPTGPAWPRWCTVLFGKTGKRAESLPLFPPQNRWGWDEQAKAGFLNCFLSRLSSPARSKATELSDDKTESSLVVWALFLG